jgi:hypothetical protein
MPEGFVPLLVFLLFVAGLVWIHQAIWGEREGTIKTDDCRARIVIKEGSSETWFKKFTCSYEKTRGGTIVGGYCEAVDINSAGACETVYVYTKDIQNSCGANPTAPYLGDDNLCHATPQ